MKNALRKQIKLLKSQNENKLEKEQAIKQKLLSLPELQKAKNVFIYLSLSSEVNTNEIIKKLLDAGKTVFVPKTVGKDMLAVIYRPPFVKSAFGTLEPCDCTVADSLCVTVTPLVAVDREFNRVGYGKGFYDKFFETEVGKNSFKVGICFDFQIVSEVIPDKFDKKLDAIISEKNILRRN